MSLLPGNPPPALSEAVSALSEPRREALLPHLLNGTSADWLSDWFKRAGQPVGATTIKLYRRRLKECASE
jgi:hypothetical protein